MKVGQVIGTGCQVRQQRTDPASALAVLLEAVETAAKHTDFSEKRVNLALASQALAVVSFQGRLVIECVDVADASWRKDVNATFCVSVEMGGVAGRAGEAVIAVQQAGQRDTAKAGCQLATEITA